MMKNNKKSMRNEMHNEEERQELLNKNDMESNDVDSHSEKCRHNDDDLLLYAYLNLLDDRFFLVSANEISLFDKYLAYAKKDDKEITVDMESNDEKEYQLVYGGIMIRQEEDINKIIQCLQNNKGTALIDLDSEADGHLIASSYDDIEVYLNKTSNERETGNYVPFVALMKTHHVLHDEEISITMFPYCGGLVWEDMINKPFLLACRETVSYDNLNKDNWKEFIDENLLMNIFSVADLYIPKEKI